MILDSEERELTLFCLQNTYSKLVAIDCDVDDLKAKLSETTGDIELHGDDLRNAGIAIRIYCFHANNRLNEMKAAGDGYNIWTRILNVLQNLVMKIDVELQEEIKSKE